ncbi:MAG: MBL fold metallo-hydrolase [Clostridia bacterium]|jgi:glyoxylase-like metal-dependent hydrolase (beta-lactamase superfamily II)
MELKQIGPKTFCIEHDTNIGIHFTDDGRMYLIDTGSKGDGEKIDEILSREGWVPSCIINTHTHIDHIGGNEFLIRKYGIPAYCTDYDMAFAHYSELEAAYMNGGYPAEKLRTIFAHPGMIGFRSLEKETPDGIDWTYLPGHSFGMIGIRTSDDIWFLGDSYLSRNFLKQYTFGFIYNVEAYIDTLKKLKEFKGALFVPSHGILETDIVPTLEQNLRSVTEMCGMICETCREYRGQDEILQQMYERLRMHARPAQHALLSSTVKSYLTYLQDRNKLECRFVDNIMKWRTQE